MALYGAPTLTEIQRDLLLTLSEREVARSAAIGLWPQLASILEALPGAPKTLRRVPVPWVPVVLSLLTGADARAAVAADPRVATQNHAAAHGLRTQDLATAAGLEPVEDDKPTPATALDFSGIAEWSPSETGAMVTALLVDADPTTLDAFAAAAFGTEREVHQRLATRFVEATLGMSSGRRTPAVLALAARYFRALAWGELGTISPRTRNIADTFFSAPVLELLDDAPPINLHFAHLLIASPASLHLVGELCTRLGTAPDLAEALRADGMAALWRVWRPSEQTWVLADHALTDAELAEIDITGHELPTHQLLRLTTHLRSVTLRDRLYDELRAGHCGNINYSTELDELRGTLTDAELWPLLRNDALLSYLNGAAEDDLVGWATVTTAEVAVGILGSFANEIRRSTLSRLTLSTTPGVLGWVLADHWTPEFLRVEAMTMLAAELGTDAEAWSTAWSLLPEFPGAGTDALATIRALRA